MHNATATRGSLGMTVRLLALAIFAGLFSLIAAPAQADPPECYEAPSLPGECLTLATYEHVIALEGENATLHEDVAAATQQADKYLEQVSVIRFRAVEMETELTQLRRDVKKWYLRAFYRKNLIQVLRAERRELYRIIERMSGRG